jgi:iron(III) transport system ATP-binding protein
MGISNSLSGVVKACGEDTVEIGLPHGSLRCLPSGDLVEGNEVNVFIRPESLSLSRKDATGNGWKGTVEFSIYHGDCWDYHVRVGDVLLRSRIYREKVGLAHGDTVFVSADQDTAIAILAGGPEKKEPSATAVDTLDG